MLTQFWEFCISEFENSDMLTMGLTAPYHSAGVCTGCGWHYSAGGAAVLGGAAAACVAGMGLLAGCPGTRTTGW